ncbi:ABC transporter [Mycena maculata]|uniref:ABC transporter n=1 Tax=Mycena maculata TaxID=230809 RepID=A0AAD7HCA3_9AGAR|nr:ABC transporter [Mycena maculata]
MPGPHSEPMVSQQPVEKPKSVEQGANILIGKKLAVVFVAMLLSISLISLDQTILATALPRIASDFNSFSLQGWVADSFLLAQTAFCLFYGQTLRLFPCKWVLVFAIAVFEIGSLICGVGQSIHQLIVGRTISGVGAAGIYISVMQVMSEVTLLKDRARLYGMFGAVFAISSIIGPLIGGAFTDHVTWRWVFFLNLPIGGVSLVAVILILKTNPPLGSDPRKRSFRDIVRQGMHMDFVGATLIAGGVTCLLMALQWGGNTKPWNSKAVIICFVFAGISFLAFVSWEVHMGERAMLPLTIFKSRSIYAIVAYCFLTRFALLVFSFYLPVFYQAAKNHSATISGIDMLPLLLAVVLCVIGSGQTIARIKYYWPFLIAGPAFLAVGSGLLYSIDTTTREPKLIGFQILIGAGIGLGMQNTLLAMQVEFKDTPKLIGQSLGMASFAQLFGGTLGLGIAEPVFASELAKYLRRYAPDAPAAIVEESPTAIHSKIPAEMIPGVLRAYTDSLKVTFVLGVPIAALALLAAVFIDNIKMVEIAPAGKPPPAADAEKHTDP